MNSAQLSLCTGARPARAVLLAPFITDAMLEYEINVPAREAAFLATIGHESGGLQWLFEIWGPTKAQRGYEGRADLGNTKAGDGKRFLGRGLIMITGRANYVLAGPPLGLDLIAWPQQLSLPGPASRSAGWFWQAHHLNELADAGDFDAICDVVNIGHKTEREGDSNGYADRLRLWHAATETLIGVH